LREQKSKIAAAARVNGTNGAATSGSATSSDGKANGNSNGNGNGNGHSSTAASTPASSDNPPAMGVPRNRFNDYFKAADLAEVTTFAPTRLPSPAEFLLSMSTLEVKVK